MTTFVGFPQDGHPFSADDVGLALAGLVAREADGTPRVGMLGSGPPVTAAGASWKVQVGEFVYVHEVGGAVQLSGVSNAEQVNIVPADGDVPAGQARIDRVVWNPAAAELLVLKGTPATSPAAPSAGAFASVGTVRVNAGDGQVVAARVARDFSTTGLVGSALTQYSPTVTGYSAGFAPVMRAQYQRVGDVVGVELQAVTDREIVRIVGPLLITTPFPIAADPIAVDGGGYFLIGPNGAKRIYELKVRHASSTQVVVELVATSGRLAELVPIAQGGFASTDWMSWRARFTFNAGA